MTNINSGMHHFFGGDGRMNRDEFNHLVKHMNINPSDAKAMWQKADKNHDGYLNQHEMRKFIDKLMCDMQKACGSNNDALDELLKCADTNGNGKLDPCELKNLMDKLSKMNDAQCDGADQSPPPQGGGGCHGIGGSGDCKKPEPDANPSECPKKPTEKPDGKCPPQPCPEKDDGGGIPCKTIETRKDLKVDMKTADANRDGKLNRDEMNKFFDNLNAKALTAGSKSEITQKEGDNIFAKFDKDTDGYLDETEQRKLRDGLTHRDGAMTIEDWNRFNNRN